MPDPARSPQLPAARALTPCDLPGVSPTGPQKFPPACPGAPIPPPSGLPLPQGTGPIRAAMREGSGCRMLRWCPSSPAEFGGAQSLPSPSSGSSPRSCPSALVLSLHPRGSGRCVRRSRCLVHRWHGGSRAWLPSTAQSRPQRRQDVGDLQLLETQWPLLKAGGGKPAARGVPRRFIFIPVSKRAGLRAS